MAKQIRKKVKEHQYFTIKPAVWRKLKHENNLDPLYGKRIRSINFYSRLFAIPAGWQRLLFAKRINKISFDGHPPLFILGLWRTGTTHLHYMMSRDNQFGFLNNHQAFTFNMSLLSFKRLNNFLNLFVPGSRPQDNVKLTLNDPAEEEQPLSTMTSRSSIHSFFFPQNQDYFRKFHLFEGITEEEKMKWKKDYMFLLGNIAVYNKKRNLLLKNPHNTARVKMLLELFPGAKFIFIHRDPYTVFSSTKKLYTQMISGQFLQFCSQKEIDQLIIENNAVILQKYLADRALIPHGNLVEIGFNDLEKSPMETLEKIYQELGLPGFEDSRSGFRSYLESVSTYKKNRFRPITGALGDRIRKKWKFWFEEFGYETNDT